MRGNADSGLNRFQYWEQLTRRLLKSDFNRRIKKAFPKIKDLNNLNIGHLARALAEYLVLEFQSTNSPLDRYVAKKDNLALSLEEKKGALVFFSDQARCTRCHTGPLFTDSRLHSVGVPQFGPGVESGDDFGAYDKLSDEQLYTFRTPSLRNLSVTAPYMHNGAFTQLSDLLSFYNDIFYGLTNFQPPSHPATQINFIKNKSTYIDRLAVLNAPVREPLGLTPLQLKQLKNFLLKSLTDSKHK